jgi:hypothetical protein
MKHMKIKEMIQLLIIKIIMITNMIKIKITAIIRAILTEKTVETLIRATTV